MKMPEGQSQHKKLWTTLATTAVAGSVALTLPITIGYADPPAPTPSPATTSAAAPPPLAEPNATPSPAVDPNAPPTDPNAPPAPVDTNAPPVDPNAVPNAAVPEANRVDVPAGGFSYLPPPGWTAGDASRISYGQAVLLKTPVLGQPAATDTSILLGRLDLRLFAGAEQDNQKAAIRLASDMGEFYMPFPGTRINQETVPLNAGGMLGSAAYYEVKFTDPNKPSGQIWAAALGSAGPHQGTQPAQNNRWFVVWLGSTNNPVDRVAAKALAESIRPYAPPPAETPAEPGAPAAPGAAPGPAPGAPAAPGAAPASPTAAPPNGSPVGVPTPVSPENAPGMLPPG